MPTVLRAALLLMTGLILLPASAVTSEARQGRQHAPATRQTVVEPPKKDCTRMNARTGYYANPWCTPQEQERWDRWESRRLTGR